MIIAGTLLLPGDGSDTGPPLRLSEGWVRTDAGRIVEVHEGNLPATFDLGGEGCLVSPGFIDTHLHLPQFDLIGAHGLSLLDWLEQVTFPAESQWADAEYAEDMTERVLDQLIAVGTTGFAAYATVHHESTRRALAASARRGFRAIVGQVLIDQQAPEFMRRPMETCLDETESLLNDWPSDPSLRGQGNRVCTAVTPRFAVTCSAELLRAAGELARRHDAYVQTHLAEMKPELEVVTRLHGGPNYTSVYHRAGLLTPKTILGHCIYLDDDERTLIAESGSIAAHCPTANSFLRSGTMDRRRCRDMNMRLALGSDIGGGYERSMIRVARAMIEASFYVNQAPPTPAEAWWQATAGNADSLGWHNTGRLSEGAEADLVVLKPDVPWLKAHNPLGMVMFAYDDRWLQATVINGELCYCAND